MNTADTLILATPTDREVVLTREFAAPRHLVFDSLTRPDLLQRWYAPAGWTLELCEVDLRVGGRWRFVLRKPDAARVGQLGVYLEVAAPERLVNTERWEDWDPGETLVTTELVEQDGRTTLTSTMVFPTKEVRDTVLHAGLEGSAGQVYVQLDALLTGQGDRGPGDQTTPVNDGRTDR